MSRTRAQSKPLDVPAEQLAALTEHVAAALDAAKATTIHTPAVLRMLVLRPLADKLSKLDLPRQRRIAIVQEAFTSFDADWAKALVASPDTIGRLLDELAASSKPRIKSPRRSRQSKAVKPSVKAVAPPVAGLRLPSKRKTISGEGDDAVAAPSSGDGVAFHTDLWGGAK